MKFEGSEVYFLELLVVFVLNGGFEGRFFEVRVDVLQVMEVRSRSERVHLGNRFRIVVQVERLRVSFHSEEVRNIITIAI